MVLARTYELAILREYHADKGPGFDIGKGLIPGRWVTLEVPGRTSGKATRFPLGIMDVDGRSYLGSMLGNTCNWVRNVRAGDVAGVGTC